MQPNQVIIGDNTGVELPVAEIEQETLVEEKKMAKYSRTAEFKRIQAFCEDRIAFYQQHLPDGREIGLDVSPTPEDWRVANRVIGEFKLLLNTYQTAKDIVDEQKNG